MTIEHVRAAADRIRGRVVRTPTIRCEVLDALVPRADGQVEPVELWLKAENLQRIGAFKARGAMNTVAQLSPEQRARGLITYSSGNHAQAVALAAREFGVSAHIAMPVDAPPIKQAGVRRLGGEITFAGTTSDHRRAAAHRIRDGSGGVIVEPFDHPHVIAGQGTATLELFEQIAEATGGARPDAVVVPVGGGGLIAGASLVCEHFGVPVYSAEPSTCDALARSLEAGERVPVPPGPTLGDGLKPTMIGALNFEIAKRAVRGSFRVDDHELGLNLVRLLVHAKLLVEPSGAAALSVAVRGDIPNRPRRIGVLLSGGNVSPALVAELLARHGGDA